MTLNRIRQRIRQVVVIRVALQQVGNNDVNGQLLYSIAPNKKLPYAVTPRPGYEMRNSTNLSFSCSYVHLRDFNQIILIKP